MIIVDVETTGMDSRLCSLLSVGAIEFENPANSFYMECRMFDGAHCEKEAQEIHGFSDSEMRDPNKKTDREVLEAFLAWMRDCKEWTIAGQNVSFDRDFLKETAYRYHIDWPLAQRTVDLHSIAYSHYVKIGKEIPQKNNHSALNLETILEHVGVPVKREKHNALEDAKLEAEAFSRFFKGRGLFPEYGRFRVPEYLKTA